MTDTKKTHIVRVRPGGVLTAIYSDALNLGALGRQHVERASHVEFDDATQGWRVLNPDGTPMLADTFPAREAALRAEVAAITQRLTERS